MTPRERIIAMYGLDQPVRIVSLLAEISDDYCLLSAELLRLSFGAAKLGAEIHSRLEVRMPPTNHQLRQVLDLAELFCDCGVGEFDFGKMPGRHDNLERIVSFLLGEIVVEENGDIVNAGPEK
jgi:hypothetical protein